MYNFLFFNVIFVTVNFNLFLAIAAILVASLCAQQTSSTPAPVYYIIVTDTSALRSLPEGTVVYPVQQPNPQPLESAPKPVHHSASSDAFTDERGQTPNAENPRRPKRARSSFYFSPSLNFVANILKMERDDDYYDYYDEESELDALGLGMSFKLGWNIKNVVALHGTLEFTVAQGDLEYTRKKEGETNESISLGDAEFSRFFFGFGATIFPFTDTSSVFHGTFFSTSLGYSFGSYADWDYYSSDDFYVGFGFKAEVGKVWAVSERWHLGPSAAFSLDGYVGYDEDDFRRTCYSLWLGINIVRK